MRICSYILLQEQQKYTWGGGDSNGFKIPALRVANLQKSEGQTTLLEYVE